MKILVVIFILMISSISYSSMNVNTPHLELDCMNKNNTCVLSFKHPNTEKDFVIHSCDDCIISEYGGTYNNENDTVYVRFNVLHNEMITHNYVFLKPIDKTMKVVIHNYFRDSLGTNGEYMFEVDVK